MIAALVHGSGYERVATPGCSDRTIRRRLDDLSVDGSTTTSPGGGEVAGRGPVDRRKQGNKRSVACDNQGVPCT